MRTGPALATPAAAAPDPALGQIWSRSPERRGVAPGALQSRERCGPGRARLAPCVPARTRCRVRVSRGHLLERWARCAGLGGLAALPFPAQPPRSAPELGPLCWRSLQGWLLLCGLFFLPSLPSQPHSGDREVSEDCDLLFPKASITVSPMPSVPSSQGANGSCGGHRNAFCYFAENKQLSLECRDVTKDPTQTPAGPPRHGRRMLFGKRACELDADEVRLCLRLQCCWEVLPGGAQMSHVSPGH